MQFYKSDTLDRHADQNTPIDVSPHQKRVRTWQQRCLAILCGLILLIGCNKKTETEGTTQPYQGMTLHMAVPSGWQFKDSWDVQLEEWSAKTGAKVELIEADMANPEKDLLPKENAPQLVLFPWTRRGELLVDKRLQAFPDVSLEESQLDWNDVLLGLREKQCRTAGGPYLLPLSSPVLVCYYRADLLEKAGLKAPESWQEYQNLLDRLPEWAPGLTAAEPWSPEFRATLFLARAVSYVKSPGQLSVFFDVDSGEPFVSSQGFVKALEVSQAAIKKLPRDVFHYDPVSCRNLVISGKAALAIGLENGPESWPLILGAASPKAGTQPTPAQRADKIAVGICQLPGATHVYNSTFSTWESHENSAYRVTYTGFAGFCAAVPRSTSPEQSTAALNLLSSLNESSQFPNGTRSPVRESQITDARVWAGQDLSAEEAGNYMASVARSLRDRQQVSELPVIGHAEFRAALTQGLTQAIEENRPAAETLSDVAEKWKVLLKTLKQDQVLRSYRRALGLSERQEY
jgi:multiple sugar transport system substrate-binding protein